MPRFIFIYILLLLPINLQKIDAQPNPSISRNDFNLVVSNQWLVQEIKLDKYQEVFSVYQKVLNTGVGAIVYRGVKQVNIDYWRDRAAREGKYFVIADINDSRFDMDSNEIALWNSNGDKYVYLKSKYDQQTTSYTYYNYGTSFGNSSYGSFSSGGGCSSGG